MNPWSIQEKWLYIKDLFKAQDGALFLVVVTVALTSFILGRSSVAEKAAENVVSEQTVSSVATRATTSSSSETPVNPTTAPREENTATATMGDAYVASKSGTSYFLPWCGGASLIKEENKIWFNSKEDAQAAGYTPAGNCKGI